VALVLRLSHKKSWYDQVDERKIHTGNVPRLGGVGFAAACIISASFITFFSAETYFGLRFIPVIVALLLTLIFGIIDDFSPLIPRYKLLIQIIAGLCVIFPGYTFKRLFYFDVHGFSWLSLAWYPISLLWLVGLTNALNFIDGVDGLAGGVSLLVSLTYAAVFASKAYTGSISLLCICLGCAVGGFLIFNMPFPKARIFMGDGGSQFLGIILALLPIVGQEDARSNIPLFYAAALLLIPIFDTTAAVWRRMRDGRRIDSPDRAHIHHKLMNLGLNDRGILGVLYGLQILIGVLVFLSIKIQGVLSLVILAIVYLIGVSFFTAIHFMNRKVMLRKNQEPPLSTASL
jgi:UDP-GlcNAc:undecaprenyl-phosphate GlcNAc-1-phosphate transferase